MSYVVIDDFKLGMDRRKARISGTPGALWEGINGHINRGGDFERRKKFVAKYQLPAGLTHGLAQYQKQLYTFGEGASPAGLPAGVNYQQLVNPDSDVDMSEIIDVTTFGGQFYAVARFLDGNIFHYYGGSRVTDWDALADAVANNATIAMALAAMIDLDPRYITSAVGDVVTIQATVAGIAFNLTESTSGTNTLTLAQLSGDGGPTPDIRASCDITIVDGSVGVFYVLNSLSNGELNPPITLWAGSPQATASQIATDILSAANGYSASVSGSTITLQAPIGAGATANTDTLVIGMGADEFVLPFPATQVARPGILTVNNGIPLIGAQVPNDEINGTFTISNAFSGGVTAIAPVAQVWTATVGGTYTASNTLTLTLDGVDYTTSARASGMGITALTFQGKVYSVTTSLLEFSELDNAASWPTPAASGSGDINVTNQNEDNDALVGIRQYQDRIAIFSRQNIQVWILAVDPSQNTFQQSVENTGALSIRSIQQYGNIDVFYLNDSGVRSLRARDASNSPAVNDVGVAIDTFIQADIAALTGTQINRACSVIEPIDGRYWLAIHNRIYAYSFFSGSRISAWTYYDLTDEIGDNDITEMVRVGNRVYIRAGDTVYLYGGDDNNTYPNDGEIVCTAKLPFLSANKIATAKNISGFDIGCSGEWKAVLLPLPSDEDVTLEIGTFDKPTYSLNSNPIQIPTPLFAIELTCSKAGPAVISNMAVHFQDGEED